MRRTTLAVLALLLNSGRATAQDFSQQQLAAAELHTMCTQDGGRLWGVDLCGPLLIVDSDTCLVWANQGDLQGALHQTAGGWTGALPLEVAIANTATDWSGIHWTMLVGPLPEEPLERRVLLAHEAWHRIQGSIGLTAQAAPPNAHLDTERGRFLLRLEMRALDLALRSSGAVRWRAARDALSFRAARLYEFPDARRSETALDRNEGFAAYTGAKLGAGSDAERYAANTLNAFDHRATLGRSYSYATGPAYGLLLDARGGAWRSHIGEATAADLLAQSLHAVSRARAISAMSRYDGAQVQTEEEKRAEQDRIWLEQVRARFVNGPRLILPMSEHANGSFDPNQMRTIPGLGIYYGYREASDVWGQLRARNGALLLANPNRIIVAEPDATGLAGPGWVLTLAHGYRLTGPDASGAFTVEAANR